MRALRWVFTDEESDSEDDEEERHWAAQHALIRRRELLRQTGALREQPEERAVQRALSPVGSESSKDSVREWLRRELESESEAGDAGPATPASAACLPPTPSQALATTPSHADPLRLSPSATRTARVATVRLQVLVPNGIQAGQQLVFQTPDGRQMYVTAHQAAPPGSLIPITYEVPDAAPPLPGRQEPADVAASHSASASGDVGCQQLELELREVREAANAAAARVQELAARCLAAEAEAAHLEEAAEGMARERERCRQESEHLVDRRPISSLLSAYVGQLAAGRVEEADQAMRETWRILRKEAELSSTPAAASIPSATRHPPSPPGAGPELPEPPAVSPPGDAAAASRPAAQAAPADADVADAPAEPERRAATARGRRLDGLLGEPVMRKAPLAEIVWVGVPEERQRCEAWQMLLGYRPLSRKQRDSTLQARRLEYREMRCGIYEGSSCSSKGGGEAKAAALQQIRVDLPRTEVCRGSPCASDLQAVVDSEILQALMERVLFVWSTQEPAAGYVQGMNDVLLPLLFVFLSERTGASLAEGELCLAGVEALPAAVLDEVEADCYWCLTAILRDIVDHYIPGQPGLRHAAELLDTQLREVDVALVEHIALQGADLNIAVMKWLGCLMVRELPVHLCARLWDTCIAESALGVRRGFSDFLIGLFVSLLVSHGDTLRQAEFDVLMEFFLRPPVAKIGIEGLDLLISEAFMHISRMAKPLGTMTESTAREAREAAPHGPAEPGEAAEEKPEPASPSPPRRAREDERRPVLCLSDLPQPFQKRQAARSVTTAAPTASVLGSTGSRCSGSQFGEDHYATSDGSGAEGRAFSCSSGATGREDHPHAAAHERPGAPAEGCPAQARKLDTLVETSEVADHSEVSLEPVGVGSAHC